MIDRVVKALRAVGSLGALVPGAAYHALTGVTPDLAYQGMIRMFCMTGGASNDLAHEAIRRIRGRRTIHSPSGVLGHLSGPELSSVISSLRRDGYYVFPRLLSQDRVDELLRIALRVEGSYQGGGARKGEEEAALRTKSFDRARPLDVRFSYEPQTLVRESAVQSLLADRSLLAVAQAYLNCDPIFDAVSMWWHTAASPEPSSESGQLFHFDMDRLKWLKFFIYLTDVDDRSGPHVFIPGSHRRGSIPWHFLRKGYRRLSDDEVFAHYGANSERRFIGSRGLILAEDTRGLHKGAPVVEGDRLVIELEFVDSLFGARYEKVRIDGPSEELIRLQREMPNLFKNYYLAV